MIVDNHQSTYQEPIANRFDEATQWLWNAPKSLQQLLSIPIPTSLPFVDLNKKKKKCPKIKAGIYSVVDNSHTKCVEEYLVEKFGSEKAFSYYHTELNQYDPCQTYDTVFVVLYRASGNLESIQAYRELMKMFSDVKHVWLVCVYGSVWDDACDYSELFQGENNEELPQLEHEHHGGVVEQNSEGFSKAKGVLQFNVWNDMIQSRYSVRTTDAMQRLDAMLDHNRQHVLALMNSS